MIRRVFEGGLLVVEEDYRQAAAPLAKSEDYQGAALSLVKSLAEHQVTIGVAYPANLADGKLAKDGHRDFAPPELVEQIAWRWMKERQEIGLFHMPATEGHGLVVESGIHRGPDWLVKTAGGETVVCEGDWVLGVEWDTPAWNWIKAHPTSGYSPQGEAYRRVPSPDKVARVTSSRSR